MITDRNNKNGLVIDLKIYWAHIYYQSFVTHTSIWLIDFDFGKRLLSIHVGSGMNKERT